MWGVYWLPLRVLEDKGVAGSWATVALFVVAIPQALILLFVARHQIKAHLRTFAWLAIFNGVVFNLYSNAYGGTTVFNVLFLFYLSPVWSILITRLWFKEATSVARIACVVVGLGGLVLMLSKDGGWPIPRNPADWMALASGFLWAIVAIRIRNSVELGAAANSAGFFVGGLVAALLFALPLGHDQVPTVPAIQSTLPLVLVIAWVVWAPSQFLLFWGVQRISPVRTGILLMTELISGVVTAAWLSGDPVTWQQALGGALIVGAGLGDVLTNRERPPPPLPMAVAQE